MANSTNNPRRSDVPAIVISLATAFAWGSLLTLSKAAGLAIACGLLFMFGFWSVLFPSRLIEWAFPVRSEVNENDQRWCWLARALGVVLMAVAAVAVVAS